MSINIGNKHIAWKGNVTSPLTFPSLPQHIYVHPCRKCRSPTAICPETPPKERVWRKKKRREPGQRGEKKKVESKAKGDAWCGRKDQSISSFLGHLHATSLSRPRFFTRHTAHTNTNTHSCPFHSKFLPTLSLSTLSASTPALSLSHTQTSYSSLPFQARIPRLPRSPISILPNQIKNIYTTHPRSISFDRSI